MVQPERIELGLLSFSEKTIDGLIDSYTSNACMRPCLTDARPSIGAIYGNIYIGTGHSK